MKWSYDLVIQWLRLKLEEKRKYWRVMLLYQDISRLADTNNANHEGYLERGVGKVQLPTWKVGSARKESPVNMRNNSA